MTTQKLLKRRVRERMAKTGEHYATARSHVGRTRDRLDATPIDLSGAREMASDDRLRAATGRDWRTWVSVLDRWGARERNHPDTAAFLREELGVPGWWAQTITGGYQRTRGMRLKHQQAHGFTVYASRTYASPMEAVFQAFVDDDRRTRWLEAPMRLRTAQVGKVARFDWGDGATRVMVTFDAKGPSKTTAYVSHERLPDADGAEIAKAAWRRRLTALRAHLESNDV